MHSRIRFRSYQPPGMHAGGTKPWENIYIGTSDITMTSNAPPLSPCAWSFPFTTGSHHKTIHEQNCSPMKALFTNEKKKHCPPISKKTCCSPMAKRKRCSPSSLHLQWLRPGLLCLPPQYLACRSVHTWQSCWSVPTGDYLTWPRPGQNNIIVREAGPHVYLSKGSHVSREKRSGAQLSLIRFKWQAVSGYLLVVSINSSHVFVATQTISEVTRCYGWYRGSVEVAESGEVLGLSCRCRCFEISVEIMVWLVCWWRWFSRLESWFW